MKLIVPINSVRDVIDQSIAPVANRLESSIEKVYDATTFIHNSKHFMSLYEIAKKESKAKDILLLSTTLHNNINNRDIMKSVSQNLENGSTYKYFIDGRNPLALGAVDEFKQLHKHRAGYKFYDVGNIALLRVFDEYVLYDPVDKDTIEWAYAQLRYTSDIKDGSPDNLFMYLQIDKARYVYSKLLPYVKGDRFLKV